MRSSFIYTTLYDTLCHSMNTLHNDHWGSNSSINHIDNDNDNDNEMTMTMTMTMK